MKHRGLLKNFNFSGLWKSNNLGGVNIVDYLCEFLCYSHQMWNCFVAGNLNFCQFCMTSISVDIVDKLINRCLNDEWVFLILMLTFCMERSMEQIEK